MENKKEIRNLQDIDSAIEECKDQIKHHRIQSYSMLLIIVLILAVIIQSLGFSEEDEKFIKLAENNLVESYRIFSKTHEYAGQLLTYSSDLHTDNLILQMDLVTNKDSDSIYKHLKDFEKSLANTRDSLTNTFGKATSTLNNSASKKKDLIDELVEYAGDSSFYKYAIFVLFITILGFVIFIYKNHLKQIRKYEHFLFGFIRIKLANSDTQSFDNITKATLNLNAFNENATETRLENPLEGNPSSDIVITLLNRLIEEIKKNK